MEATGSDEERSVDGAPPLLMSPQCLAARCWPIETTRTPEDPPGTRSTGSNDDQEHTMNEERFSRQAMIQAPRTISFSNDSDWSFLNSSLMCFLWSHLHRRGCNLGGFGAAAAVCEALLLQPGGQAVPLATMPALSSLLRRTVETGPRDCAEFTAELLEWCACCNVDMSWARRVSMADHVVCEETGGKCQPLALDGMYELDLASMATGCELLSHRHKA